MAPVDRALARRHAGVHSIGATMASEAIEGGCLCGAVRYRVNESPRSQGTCYCENCRRAAGAPSVAWIIVSRGQVDFTSAEPS
jgi:hypothetical protein